MITKIDEVVKVCVEWNNKKITSREAMFRIFKINQKYILSEINPKQSKKKCLFCGKKLPEGNISYCDNSCKYADKKKISKED